MGCRLACRVAHHHRAQEHHQVGFLAAAVFALEQVAQQGHVAQAGHLVLVARVFVFQQAAQHHDAPSSTSTLDSMERLLVVGPLAEFDRGACTLDTSW
jgi:plasmid stability protein